MAITKTDTGRRSWRPPEHGLEWTWADGLLPCSSISWLALRAPLALLGVRTCPPPPQRGRACAARNRMVWVCASMHVVYVTKTAMKYMKQ